MKAAIILLFIMAANLYSSAHEAHIKDARLLFYQAVEDEDKLQLAIDKFELLKNKSKLHRGVSETYIGSLTMLKGKYAFWPMKKLSYVEEGLEIMDAGIALDPSNIESLFIYGSTCYYLPFFLGKADLAEEKLRKIITLLNDKTAAKYDKEILKNALTFLKDELELSAGETKKIDAILSQI